MIDAPHTLSANLAALRHWLRECEHGGVVLDSEACTALAGEIKEMLIEARRMEHELDRLRWNERARGERRAEQVRAAALADALQLPNTNVALFPVVARPRPGSAA